jgi:hypothetical protein
MADVIEFIECGSLNISYDVLGLASVSFTVVSNNPNLDEGLSEDYTTIEVGDLTFTGYISGATARPILSTDWAEWGMTLVMTSDETGG